MSNTSDNINKAIVDNINKAIVDNINKTIVDNINKTIVDNISATNPKVSSTMFIRMACRHHSLQ